MATFRAYPTAAGTTIRARAFFKTGLDIPAIAVLGLVVQVDAIALGATTLIAWRTARVRPLEVLRYE